LEFQQHGRSGAWLSELLPHTARVVDELCVIRSLHTEAINHDPAVTLLQTGHQQPGRPSFGAWTSYGFCFSTIMVSQGQPPVRIATARCLRSRIPMSSIHSPTTSTTSGTSLSPAKLPPLESGDHLSRDEFERRFDATSDLKRAELLEGVVFVPPPLGFRSHGSPDAAVHTWLGVYRSRTLGTRCAANCSVRLDLENMPQPDALLMIQPECGGQALISKDDYVTGAPELIVEVSSSTASIDLNTKLRVYRRNQVREYLVWRVRDQAFDWFVLRGSDYERLPPDERGILKSAVFPGLWLDSAAMLRDDLTEVLRVLDTGTASPEHAAFVAELAARMPPSS